MDGARTRRGLEVPELGVVVSVVGESGDDISAYTVRGNPRIWRDERTVNVHVAA